MKAKSYEIDMCNGPLAGKILLFTLPLILSGILQLLFNAADIIVVGRYAGSDSMAAVGSNTALINLLVNLFMGLSVGANVVVANFFGAKKDEAVSDTVHTAIAVGLIGGILLALIGVPGAEQFLVWMGTPDNVLDLAKLYLQIYFLGMPAFMLYNFGAAILRAVGDTKRPLMYLMAAGVINLILNLCFVIRFHMGVAGVGLATVLSQIVSTLLVLRALMRSEGSLKLEIRKIKVHKEIIVRILRVGLPAGLQGIIFAASNVLIQSSVNSFGSVTMAGNTAAGNIEGFVYTSMNAFYQANISFTSQNYGAHQFSRIKKSLLWCECMVIVTGLLLGWGAVLFGEELLRIYSTQKAVIEVGMLRLKVICGTYAFCGIMDVLVGSIRGLGYGMLPMIVSLMGACVFRVIWIFTVFRQFRSLVILYASYPISWILTASVHLICFIIIFRKKGQKA